MVVKNRSISHLIEDQLPEFIVTDYPLFARFLEKYYEQAGSRGQPFDILNNLEAYRDIDYYEESILNEKSPLIGIINNTDSTVEVEDASSFPPKNGYIKIDAEICFYKEKRGNTFYDVSRGVSGNTKLGDLYRESEFVTTQAAAHSGTDVYNVSNLFLYALVKNFELDYLDSFPQKYLKKEIDKRTLIKNISNFYKVKGTETSIKFIFNTIVARDSDNVPITYNPKDFTLKSSTSDWTTSYSLKAKITGGDPKDLIGNRITQNNGNLGFSSAVVDNVMPVGGANGEQLYEVILNQSTVNGSFKIASRTELEKDISETSQKGDIVTVQSTVGWKRFGNFVIDNERFTFNDKNVKQFTLLGRDGSSTHAAGTPVYDYSPAVYRDIEVIIFGVLYDLESQNNSTYSLPGDSIQSTLPGFSTKDRIVYDVIDESVRWRLNLNNTAPNALTNSLLQAELQKYIGGVSALYEDDQFYYICSSGYPTYDILTASSSGSLSDAKNLKIVRKRPTQTTEIYKTTDTSVGVFIDGTCAYSFRDEDSVKFGEIQTINITQKGSGYKAAPYVLINNQPNKARAFLSGETIDRIDSLSNDSYSTDPTVTITSGRNAEVRAIVTNGKVTSLVIENPGEYYSSPPIIRITDRSGKGKFASFNSIIDDDGKLVDFERIETGRLYSQQFVQVEVISEGKFAGATANIRKWVKNRYTNQQSSLDQNGGTLFDNKFTTNKKVYGVISNPRRLRYLLDDNISNTLVEASILSHSPIIGYAYDGNPIYGPYGYSDPGDKASSISRMNSGYSLKSSRPNGPSTTIYSLGTFIDDYKWGKSELTGKTTLDENNGRYCVTPEYPEGTYAYFVSITSNGSPAYPYILGENYYSLPIASNYDGSINQDDLPTNVSRLNVNNTLDSSGYNSVATIRSTTRGSVTGASIFDSPETFSIGCQVEVNDSATKGKGVFATVSEVTGKSVTKIESAATKAVKINTIRPIYFFEGDVITQGTTLGTVVGDSFNVNEFLLRDVDGTFNTNDKIRSNRNIITVIVDKESEYTKGSTVSLFDGIDSIIATANVLESTKGQNAVRLQVLTGQFVVDASYSLVSNQITDTSGSKILSVITLSSNVGVFSVNDKIVSVFTSQEHNLSVNDTVNVSVIPDDTTTESTYYIRKRTFQQVKLQIPNYFSTIRDTGIGRIDTLLAGTDYADATFGGGTFTDVEVVFTNPDTARSSTGQIVGSGAGTTAVIGNEGGERNAKATVTVGFTKVVESFVLSTNTITCDTVDNVYVGQNVKGENIAANTVVSSINSANRTVTLSNPDTVDIFTGNINFAIFNPGVISNVSITDRGTTYRKGDLISFKNTDVGKPNLAITRDYIGVIDHVGYSSSDSTLRLTNARGLSKDDLLQIGSEVVKVFSVDIEKNTVETTRSENNTDASDHFNGSTVTLINPQYRFNTEYRPLGNTSSDPYVAEYDSENQILTVNFAYIRSGTTELELSSVFNDQSVPAKSVNVIDLVSSNNKFEYSKQNVDDTFKQLETLEIQNYYKYKFITDHVSMVDTYLEFSPSINKNTIAVDSFRNSIAPGSAGSYIVLKPGANFGYFNGFSSVSSTDTISENSIINKKPSYKTNFTNYYFFDKNNDVETFNNSFSIVPDPLEGEKQVIYKTDKVFVYSYEKEPQYDGSGTIMYTTNGKSAIGKAYSIKIENVGEGYDIIPSVIGIIPSIEKRATLELSYDSVSNNIANVRVVNGGSGYSKPKAVITGNGLRAEIDLLNQNGKIAYASIVNKGFNYTELPEVKIVETDLECYLSSNDIGIPESVEVTTSGFLFNTDISHRRKYFSNTQLTISNFDINAFFVGEKITQEYQGLEYASGVVAKNGYRKGTNILRLESVKGEFIKGLSIKGAAKENTATVEDISVSEFSQIIKSFSDNIGFYTSDKGKLSQYTQRITDSYFYQDYSYVIKSKTPMNMWRDLILQTTHPAGFKVFGEVIINTEEKSSIKRGGAVSCTKIDLSVPQISQHNQFRTIHQSFVNFNNIDEQYGAGTVYVNAQNNTETYATQIIITTPFDGVIDPVTGVVAGTKTFVMIDKSTNLPITPFNEQQLLVTIDGVVQEPGEAFTISGSNITFDVAPLGQQVVESQVVPAQKFHCRSFRFKRDELNAEYLKKIRNFFQRGGTWLDAANQIKFNKDFIVEESIGYAIENHPNVPWNIYEQKCSRDIRIILDSIEHDIRFGGNTKVHNAGSSYFLSTNSLDHIENELTESLDTFKYAAKLCSAALRNWDYSVTNAVITPTSNVITVPDTFGIVVGMNVSSGSQFPTNTKVTEVVNDTQIRVSNNARVAASTALLVSSGTTEVISVDTTVTTVVNEGNIEVGTTTVASGGTTTLTSTYSVTNIPQATFSLSKINNGTYYDASNLIAANKTYIQEESLGWVKTRFPNLIIPNETKCKRDTGLLVDAVIHNLRFGGTTKIIDFAKSYYVGNKLKHIKNEITESVEAYKFAISLMVLAMRGSLPSGNYTSETPYYDTNILDDPNQYFPKCAEVESALNSYAGIIDTLLLDGIGLIQPEPENNQRSGNWTSRRTYSNYNIIPDPLLLAQECTSVVESIKTLNGVLSGVLNGGPNSVTKTNPDFIDGENTDFELYYVGGERVKTAPSEDLLVFINGVVQLYDSYDIIRSEDPLVTDMIRFSQAPRWEQEANVLTVQEPLAVDKTFIVRTGSYEKAVIDSDLVRIKGTGPFPLYDSEDGKIKYIDDDRYAYVFVDGVFQRRGDSYTQSGSTITFKKPLVSTTLEDGTTVANRVDVLVLYGRDLDQKLTFYDFEPETYLNEVTVTITEEETLPSYPVTADLSVWYFVNNRRSDVFVYELISGSTTNFQILGNFKYSEFTEPYVSNLILTSRWNLYPIQSDSVIILSSAPTWYDVVQQYNNPPQRTKEFRSLQLDSNLIASFKYYENSDDERLLTRDAIALFYKRPGGAREYWDEKSGPLINLRPGDRIKVDGEKTRRTITTIPDFAKTRDFRNGEEVPNFIHAELTATGYNGYTEGEGLAAVAEVDPVTGGITKLVWNKRNLQLFVENNYKDKQTAYGYLNAPFLKFVPRDEFGGGARAEVLVIDGDVVDVYITDPGSGYTQPPQVITTRGYTRIKEKKVSYGINFRFLYRLDVRSFLPLPSAEVTLIVGGVQPVVYSSFEVLQSPKEASRQITQEIYPYVDLPVGEFTILPEVSRFFTTSWTAIGADPILPNAPEVPHTKVLTTFDSNLDITIDVDDTYRRVTQEINSYIEPYNEFNFQRFITSGWTTAAPPKEMPDVPEDSFAEIWTRVKPEVVDTAIAAESAIKFTQEINSYIEPYNKFGINPFITSSWTTAAANEMPPAPEDSLTEVIISVKPISTDVTLYSDRTSRFITGIISLETAKVPEANALDSTQDIGTILSAPMSDTADYAYILSTARFPDEGRLFIGDEFVSYATKQEGRILDVERGLFGTAVQNHPSGEYIRLLVEMVSVIPDSGISDIVESEISIVTVSESPTEITNIISTSAVTTITETVIEIVKNSILYHEVLAYISRIVSEEEVSAGISAVVESEINLVTVSEAPTKVTQIISTSAVTTIADTAVNVTKRLTVGVVDLKTGEPTVKGHFSQGIVGPSIATFASQIGFVGIGESLGSYDIHPELSSLESFDQYYPGMTIEELSVEFYVSALTTESGLYFNYGPLSINNPLTVTTSQTQTSSSTTLNVQSTEGFPNSGNLYISKSGSEDYTVISYTNISASQFINAVFVKGTTSLIESDSLIIPHTINLL